MTTPSLLNIGTCSWKYDSWQGILYSGQDKDNYLPEYSRHFATVEIDQWFWSLFAGDKAVLPSPRVVRQYAESVPEDFVFGIKVPNSITLTHYYKKQKTDTLDANPHFLSRDLMQRFLDSLAPLGAKIGPLIFQFEYLNKEKMAGVAEFIEKISRFVAQLPAGLTYCLEIRNANYLTARYFDFLRENGLHHVFLHGYYMPPIFDLYRQFRDRMCSPTVIRLHGPDRQEIEKLTGKNWSQVVAPKDEDLLSLVDMLEDLAARNLQTFLYVNNHFEGSAPRTIARIKAILAEKSLEMK